jgi:hypothetical protein
VVQRQVHPPDRATVAAEAGRVIGLSPAPGGCSLGPARGPR